MQRCTGSPTGKQPIAGRNLLDARLRGEDTPFRHAPTHPPALSPLGAGPFGRSSLDPYQAKVDWYRIVELCGPCGAPLSRPQWGEG
jgi:hypothetical protein